MNDTLLVGAVLALVARIGCLATALAGYVALLLFAARMASWKWHPDKGRGR